MIPNLSFTAAIEWAIISSRAVALNMAHKVVSYLDSTEKF